MKLLLLLVPLFMALMVTTAANAQQDITPPALLDVRFEPEVIDTSKGPATITVTVHVTDDLSGMNSVALFFRKSGTTQKNQVEFRSNEPVGKLIEGDMLDGRYQNTMTLPQYAAYGEWEMYYFMLMDNVGNRVDIWKPENEEEAEQGTEEWPALYNGFSFAVGQADEPQEPDQPARQLFIPSVQAE